jgi:hypothetical protein
MRRTGEQSEIGLFEGVSATLVGGGIVTLALFPLAVPIIVLTAIALLPLVLPALAAGLILALVALPILLARRLWRRMSVRASAPTGAAEPGRSS